MKKQTLPENKKEELKEIQKLIRKKFKKQGTYK
jgi:hypothetical protein